MTNRENFEVTLKDICPNMPRDFNEAEGYYYHDIAQLMWKAWNARSRVRPSENSRMDKATGLAPSPETLVDRLNGIYGQITYKPSALEKEAARTIEHLREKLASAKGLTMTVIELCEADYGTLCETNMLRELIQ